MSANLIELFFARQAGFADKTAITWGGEPHCRFGELPQQVGRYRAALVRMGVTRGDRVMVKTDNSPEFVFTYLAVLASGAIFVPVNTAYTAAEVAAMIEDAAPALLVHGSATRLPDEAPGGPLRMTLEPDGSGTLAQLVQGLAPDLSIEALDRGDLAAILFTSGTTGRPKGAMLSHGNLSSNVTALHEIWAFSDEDSILHCLPLFHAHGLFVALHLGLFSPATLRMEPRFDATSVARLLGDTSVFMGVPTFYSRLLELPCFDRELCANMRLFISGSAPLLPSVHAEFETRTGHRILERYGMTEALMITSNPYAREGRIAGTVGYPLPGVSLRVVGSEGQELPAGEMGEFEIKGPNLCSGYWLRPEATAESFDAEGFFRTGDVGHKAPDGRVTIAGRSKDLIISGGFNVYPAEIEILFAEVEGISDVAVFGVPHPDFGEAVVTAVIADTPGFDIDALHRVARESLARFKQPKAIHLLSEFPRNAMGKVLKNELRKRYQDSFAALETSSGA
jgi:malonyl-CoA/methylmalonyl-CoA synthetase